MKAGRAEGMYKKKVFKVCTHLTYHVIFIDAIYLNPLLSVPHYIFVQNISRDTPHTGGIECNQSYCHTNHRLGVGSLRKYRVRVSCSVSPFSLSNYN